MRYNNFLVFFIIIVIGIFTIFPHAFAATTQVVMSPGAGSGQYCVTANNCFSPNVVNIAPGDTVTWTNQDSVGHTVTSGHASDTQTGTLFDSSLITAGSSYSLIFNGAGTYQYFCMVHPWMTGIITVSNQGSQSIPPSTQNYPIFGATIELHQKVYTWTDRAYITVVAPSCNTNPNVVDIIGYAGSCGTISIKTSKGQLDSYSLTETGPDTGIFTGYVTLTGFPNYDAKGDETGYVSGNTNGVGPTDGQIATSSNDNIQVTFTHGSTSITGSAIIRWNIGEIQWVQSSYAPNGQGVLQIVDPDMNLDPNAIDTFNTNVRSSSDPNGIKITMTETGQDTGIFQGTVNFSTSLQSAGNILHVSEGDTVTGEYVDRTLPAPYAQGDQLRLTATTSIGYTTPPPTIPQTTPPSSPNNVIITPGDAASQNCISANNCFNPSIIQVPVGTTVTWTNNDNVGHTTTSGHPTDNQTGTLWDSSLIKAGGSYSFTFQNSGTYPYFCMVHPWMTGEVIVGSSSQQPISVTTDKSSYQAGDLVTINIQSPSLQPGQTVAIMLADPSGNLVASRTITTIQNSNTLQIGLPQTAQTGSYQVTATSSSSGTLLKGSDQFTVAASSNPPSQVSIVSVQPTNQQGSPVSSFGKGTTGFAKVVLSSQSSQTSLITVNLAGADSTSLGVGTIKMTLPPGQTEIELSFSIPSGATSGTANIYADVFSDWPTNGGTPLTGELSGTVGIQ